MSDKPFHQLSAEEQEARLAEIAKGRKRETHQEEAPPENARAEGSQGGDEDRGDEADRSIRDVLDAGSIARIRAEARAYVDEQVKQTEDRNAKEAEERYREDLIARYRREAGIANYLDDLIEYTPNLAPFAVDMKIDGTVYEHGRTVRVTRAKFDTMREIEARGWLSEEMAGNPNSKFRRNPQINMNPLHMRMHELGHAMARETSLSAQTGIVINPPANNYLLGGIPARK